MVRVPLAPLVLLTPSAGVDILRPWRVEGVNAFLGGRNVNVTRMVLRVIVLGIAAVAVAGCGSAGITGGPGPSSSPSPTPSQGSCGSFRMGNAGPGVTEGSPLNDARCFENAVKTCQAATLTVSDTGVDAGTVYTYSVDTHNSGHNASCRVNASVLSYVVPISQTRTTFTCQSLTATDALLTLSNCGKTPSIRIPLSSPSMTPLSPIVT